MSYNFVTDSANSKTDLPAVNLSAAWTIYNSPYNPFLKGEKAHTYNLYGDVNGRLFERSTFNTSNTFSKIIDTDYSTYFVEYACKQSAFDLWTVEYIDIFTKDGTIASSSKTLADIKTTVLSLAPTFDTTSIVVANSENGCPYTTNWLIF